MGRIRKKSSKRGTTFQRSKIHKKAAETRRKTKKAGKRDQTWKSKKKVDPGIPNSFPFKDQVLAELAAEKRQIEETKQARKDASKSTADEEDVEAPGILSLGSSSVLTATAPSTSTKAEPSTATEADVPELVDTELATLQDVLDRADVVCQVVDARDVLGGRSRYVERLVRDAGGRMVLVMNKIDLVPRETLQAWLTHLAIPTYLFSSHCSPSASTSSSVLGSQELLAYFRQLNATRGDEDLVIALMGLPSVGKTSILNSFLPPSSRRHTVTPIVPTAHSAKHPAPTTAAPVEVAVDIGEGRRVRMIDTPGWEYTEDEVDEEDDDAEDRFKELEESLAADLLRRNLGRVDRVKDVLPLAHYVVKRSNAQDLMLCYNVPFFREGDVEAFLTSLARAGSRVKKHGEADLEAAARILLRDWAHNTFPYYTSPPSGKTEEEADGHQPDMEAVLLKCRGRKEMRRESGKGLVRFRCGTVDERQVILDDDYTTMAGPSDEDVENEEEEEEDELEDGFEGDEMALRTQAPEEEEENEPMVNGEEDEEEEEVPPTRSLKRKAVTLSQSRTKPKRTKSVSFAVKDKGAETQGGKRKR